jgi:hypothetical protein
MQRARCILRNPSELPDHSDFLSRVVDTRLVLNEFSQSTPTLRDVHQAASFCKLVLSAHDGI